MILPPRRVLENIAKGKISAGYLLLGQEVYWRDRIWSALRQAAGLESVPDGLAELDLRQHSLDQVLEKARERNLWAPRQLVLVRNAAGLTPTKGLANLAAYFKDPSPFSILVFEAMDVDLETEDWREREKAKSRQEAWESICDVVALMSPGMGEAIELVQQEAAQRGRNISPQAAEALVAALDRDMGRMVPELEKLCLYSSEENAISPEEVYALLGSATAHAGLSLTDAIGSGDARKALEVLAEVEREGSYFPLIVSEVARYVRQILLLKEGNAREPRQAARVLWAARLPAPQNAMPDLLKQARAFSTEHLLRCLELAFETDLALRSSPADERLVLERFVLEIVKPLRIGVPPMILADEKRGI